MSAKAGKSDGVNPSQRIDQLLAETTDWRGEALARVRKAFLAADDEIVEEWKWMGSPTWERDGIIAVANPHKGKVKVTFAYGASLADLDKLFNCGFEGNARRAIDYFEDDEIDERALRNLVREAIAFNQNKAKTKLATAPRVAAARAAKTNATSRPSVPRSRPR